MGADDNILSNLFLPFVMVRMGCLWGCQDGSSFGNGRYGDLVNDIAPKRELPDDIGAPLAELCGTDGVDTIAHRNDCIKVL